MSDGPYKYQDLIFLTEQIRSHLWQVFQRLSLLPYWWSETLPYTLLSSCIDPFLYRRSLWPLSLQWPHIVLDRSIQSDTLLSIHRSLPIYQVPSHIHRLSLSDGSDRLRMEAAMSVRSLYHRSWSSLSGCSLNHKLQRLPVLLEHFSRRMSSGLWSFLRTLPPADTVLYSGRSWHKHPDWLSYTLMERTFHAGGNILDTDLLSFRNRSHRSQSVWHRILPHKQHSYYQILWYHGLHTVHRLHP